MTSLNPVMLTFPLEKSVFSRENNSNMYRVISYYIGKSIIEIPMIVLVPIIVSLVFYWMVGLNDDSAENVIIFIFVGIL
jgi:hypothetical protein